MRLLVAVLAAFLAAGAAAAADGPARRIMSINLCSDALLLSLVPRERVISVSYLSRASSYSQLAAQARQVGVNHGLAEEVLAEHPDLVLAGTYTTPDTRQVLKQLGVPLLEVPPADDFDQIRAVTRQVAKAVGEVARGEALLKRMDATLQELSATRPSRPIRVISWDGGGHVPGQGTLFDAILTAAGGINLGAQPGLASSSLGLEQLLTLRPDVLAFGDANLDAPSLRSDASQHPLIMSLYAGRRVAYPELLYSCGLPQSAQAARLLRAQLLAAMAAPGPAP